MLTGGAVMEGQKREGRGLAFARLGPGKQRSEVKAQISTSNVQRSMKRLKRRKLRRRKKWMVIKEW